MIEIYPPETSAINCQSTLITTTEERRPPVAIHIPVVPLTMLCDVVSEYLKTYGVQRIISHKATAYYERTLINILILKSRWPEKEWQNKQAAVLM